MNVRREPSSSELIYSESDVAEMRERWEMSQKDARVSEVLNRIQGQISGFGDTIRTTARQVVLEVLAEQKRSEQQSRRSDLRLVAAWVAAVVVFLVPIEDVIISHLIAGRP